jgi:hypothetical protein
MARSQAKQEAIDALNFIQKEADLRKEINSSYDSYIEQIKQYSTLQKAYNKSVELEAKTRKKIDDINNGIIQASQHELDVETEKLAILEKQNKKLEEQGKIYQAAFKDANKWSLTAAGGLKAVGSAVGLLKQGFGMIKSLGLFEMDKAMKNSALSMGVLSTQAKGFRDTITTASKQTAYIGVSLQDIAKIQSDYSEELGRSVQMNEKSLVAMGQLSKFADLGAEGAARMAADMDKQGFSAEKTGEFMNQTLNDSHAMGVNASKVIKNIAGNIKMLNKYRFKDGVKGLAKMAMTASKLGVDMEFASGMSDKMWDIEGAIDMSAQLQVMGGAWAQMADPFHLMYMARNDMEGLTEEIANAAKQSMSFGKDGSIEMGAMEMHRLKIVAQQTGLEYEKLVEAGKAAFKLGKIKAQVGGVSPELQEFIANTAEFKDGKATVMVNGNKKLISALTPDDKKFLEKQRLEKQSMKERAEQALTFDEAFTNVINGMKIYLMPIITAINENLLPRLKAFGEKFENGGWGEKIEVLATAVGEFVVGVGKIAFGIIDILGPKGTFITALALWGGLKALTWVANGVALAKGFNMAARGPGSFGGGGGSGGGMFGKFGSTKGGMSFGKSLARGLGTGAVLGVGSAAMDYGRSNMEDPNSTGGKLLGVGSKAASWAATGAMIGSIIPGLGTAAGGIIGGLLGAGVGAYDEGMFGQPTEDGLFEGDNPIKSLGKLAGRNFGGNFNKGNGVIKNGKIHPIDNKDDLVAMKNRGIIDNHINKQSNQNSKMEIDFDDINVKGSINITIPGTDAIALDIMKTTAFRTQIVSMVNSQLEINKNGKTAG